MIDARGLSCPMPVVLVQKAVKQEAPTSLEVLVDNECAVENVTRFAKSCQYAVAVAKDGSDSRITLTK
ncbi:MAG: sulfurtransferase TusA family protein [Oscillospiraceae bacterium]